jgi:diadenosine tetraphosphate (Ap4A) HIT family hydrolase
MACAICDTLAAPPEDTVVYEDDLFCAYQVADVPGWITIATKAHVEGPDEMDDAQAAGLGRVVRDVVRALKVATDAERVHVVYLGEHSRHLHAGLFPRAAGQPALLGNERLMAELGEAADPARAAAVRATVRDAVVATSSPG